MASQTIHSSNIVEHQICSRQSLLSIGDTAMRKTGNRCHGGYILAVEDQQ